MKKNGLGVSLYTPCQFIKCLLMMKFILLLIVAFSVQSFAHGYGQDNISLHLEKVSFKKVFKDIEKQGSFRFVYKDEILPRDQRVSITVENASLDDVLTQVLQNTSLTYRKLSGSLVVITSGAVAPALIPVSGKITDDKGEPLAGVTVLVKVIDTTIVNHDTIYDK